MACRIALHQPLEKLRKVAGASVQCHSSRPHCQMGLNEDKDATTVLGIQGAALGYCQGLLNKREGDNPEQHTAYFTEQLRSLNAPFFESHELLITQKPSDMHIGEYIQRAAQPLLIEGRIPILITDYEVEKDYSKIREIFDSHSPVKRGESMLVRMTLNSDEAVDLTGQLINKTIEKAKSERRMPRWWPLLQNGQNNDENRWDKLHDKVGSNWDYVTLAVHPFSLHLLNDYKQNVIVAQWLVGKPGEIYPNGDVALHTTSCILSGERNQYNIYEFGQQLKDASLNPTSIICGGSMPEWKEADNLQRLQRYLLHFQDAIKSVWNLNEGKTQHLLSLAS